MPELMLMKETVAIVSDVFPTWLILPEGTQWNTVFWQVWTILEDVIVPNVWFGLVVKNQPFFKCSQTKTKIEDTDSIEHGTWTRANKNVNWMEIEHAIDELLSIKLTNDAGPKP